MKIALLNTYRVIQGRGGAEKVFCELANGFAQCGHEVLALAYDEAEGRPFYPLDSRVIFMNTWSGRNVLLSVVEKVKTFSFSKEIRRDRRRKLQQRKLGSSDFLVKQGARWYPGRGQNWLVRRMQRSSLLNYRNRCQNLVGARRKHTRPHPHQAEPDQVPALQSAAYAAE